MQDLMSPVPCLLEQSKRPPPGLGVILPRVPPNFLRQKSIPILNCRITVDKASCFEGAFSMIPHMVGGGFAIGSQFIHESEVKLA